MRLTCAACGKEGKSAVSLDAMREEFFRLHPGKPFNEKQVAIICGDCHQIEIEMGLVHKGTVQ